MKRSHKDKAANQARHRKRGNNSAFDPSRCPLCDSNIDSIRACVAHLSSNKHIDNIGGLCGCNYEKCAEFEPRIVSMLKCPTRLKTHLEWGFDVDKIISAVADGSGLPRGDGAKDHALLLTPDFNWMTEISRTFVGWDGQNTTGRMLPLTKVATIAQATPKMRHKQLPPAFNPPSLPLQLPVVKRSTKILQYPYVPGLALPFALLKANGDSLEGIDVITSTSFLHALSGNSGHMKDRYLIQRIDNTFAIFHLRKKIHNSVDIGPLVEQICCPPQSKNAMSYSVSRIRIAGKTFMFTTEVDGYDSQSSETVEVKAKKSQPTKTNDLIQIMTNGSSRIVNFKPSDDSMSLESSKTFTRDEVLDKNKESWIYTGQRIRYLIPVVLGNPAVMNAVERPVVMTFDDAKLPVFAQAPAGYTVIPPDFK